MNFFLNYTKNNEKKYCFTDAKQYIRMNAYSYFLYIYLLQINLVIEKKQIEIKNTFFRI
jgi:hypothetical protein